ncbi:MAG TPA: (2Fe-2S)-binding protein [Pseudogracilibacillus sp.]|nr:(2Fe-2S)-binding protein [Pseudogracilibacillus sp.]
MERITNHQLLKNKERKKISFFFNEVELEGFEGEPIAVALLANNIRNLRVHEESGSTRGIYCNIGHCFECRVMTQDSEVVRACLTPIYENMKITSLTSLPNPVKDWSDKHV